MSLKVNISTICWLVCVLAVSSGATSSATSSSGKDLLKPLKQYLLTRLTQEKIKQFDDSLKQYFKTLSFLKGVSDFHKRSWRNEFSLPQGFGDFKYPDFDHEEKSLKVPSADYDSVVGGWWADEPFLDLNYLPVESRDEWNQVDKTLNDEWKHTASAFQTPGQFGHFSGGTMEGLRHDDVWGKFRSKRSHAAEEEAKE